MTKQSPQSHLTLAGLATALLCISSPSFADTHDMNNAWTGADRSLTHVGDDFTKNRADLVKNNEILFTTDSSAPGLLFICAANKMRASVTTTPQDWQSVLKQSTRRSKTKSVHLTLDDGQKMNIGNFIYKPSLKTLNSRNAKQAVQLYNAVVNGQQITLKMGSRSPIVLNPPKPNSAFADFGSQCGIGRHKQT